MKKKGKWLLFAFTAACCAVFAGYLAVSRHMGDHAAPVISFPEGELTVSVGAGFFTFSSSINVLATLAM